MLVCSAVLLPCSVAAAAESGSVDAGWVLQKLARPAPMQTGFVEVRDSKLLKEPLRIAGEYRRPDAGTLVREVRSPYQEITTIRDGQASIQRGGKTRTFALSRVPELAGLQASFGALLAGDRAALEKLYAIKVGGSRNQWTLTLQPRDAQLATRVKQIVLFGRGAELRCIETTPAKGSEIQRTLMAGAARDATAVKDGTALAKLCHAG